MKRLTYPPKSCAGTPRSCRVTMNIARLNGQRINDGLLGTGGGRYPDVLLFLIGSSR